MPTKDENAAAKPPVKKTSTLGMVASIGSRASLAGGKMVAGAAAATVTAAKGVSAKRESNYKPLVEVEMSGPALVIPEKLCGTTTKLQQEQIVSVSPNRFFLLLLSLSFECVSLRSSHDPCCLPFSHPRSSCLD
jgi:hypothetical protein